MTAATLLARAKAAGEVEAELPFVVSADALAAHHADMARRQAERDAKRPLLMKCINPDFAAACEAEKPVYDWRVQAKFDIFAGGSMEPVEIDERIAAQNEPDAWALVCDRLQVSIPRRLANPTFKRGKQLSAKEIIAKGEESTPEKERRKLAPPKKK